MLTKTVFLPFRWKFTVASLYLYHMLKGVLFSQLIRCATGFCTYEQFWNRNTLLTNKYRPKNIRNGDLNRDYSLSCFINLFVKDGEFFVPSRTCCLCLKLIAFIYFSTATNNVQWYYNLVIGHTVDLIAFLSLNSVTIRARWGGTFSPWKIKLLVGKRRSTTGQRSDSSMYMYFCAFMYDTDCLNTIK